MKNILIASVLLLILLPASAGAATINATSCSYADVLSAINAAQGGDTVLVPAGSCTWNNQLVITKGIYLIGAGMNNTVITSNYSIDPHFYLWDDSFLITYNPSNPSANEPFRISGLTIDCAVKCYGIMLHNPTITPINKVRVDHTKILNPLDRRPSTIQGPVYGVADNNEWHGFYMQFFHPDTAWSYFTFDFGTANNFYLEDNIFYGFGDLMTTSAAAGTRYCYRHNTFDGTACTNGIYPIFDAHGNSAWSGTMGVELYENTFTLPSQYGATLFDQRGGKALVYNNNVTGQSAAGQYREEYLDSLYSPANGPTGQPQHVSDSYWWNNRLNNSTKIIARATQTLDYGGDIGIVPRENVHFWVEQDSFDGTTGMGVGLLNERPATCTLGVGYWANDTKTLYKCNSTNTWIAYYTPYTYPHPLRTDCTNYPSLCDSGTKTINANSCSQADVQAAVNSANSGDTVLVPAGNCVWTTDKGTACYSDYVVGVCIRKGIKFQGGVGGETVITFGPGFTSGGLQIYPDTSSLSNNATFEVVGFTFDGNGTSMNNGALLSIISSRTIILSNVKIHGNVFKSVTSRAVDVNGLVNGVLYENTFTDVGYCVTTYGYDNYGWGAFERKYGGADNFFIEDNIINFTIDMSDVGGTDHGQGAPGYVFRYNTFDLSNTIGGWLFTIHGLQSMAVSAGYTCPSGCGYESCSPSISGSCNETAVKCEQWSTIKSEYYGNKIVDVSYFHSFMGHRGSWLMMFYNGMTGIGSAPSLGYAQFACDSCQSPSTPAYSQHVQNSYIFRNTYNGANVKMTKGLDYCADASIGTPYVITENVDYWNENSGFDGTSGVGVGKLADRPSTCTVGVGYWATEQSTSDFTGMTGIHPTTPISGTFYKCTSANTWTEYYKPYTYPHPLRAGSSPPIDVPGDLNGDGMVDINDLSFVGGHFGRTNTHPLWNATADVVANNEIDVYDVVFVASRFS